MPVRYCISHTTIYIYDRPVSLAPHTIRLRPRSDAAQTLHRFDLRIHPQPLGIADNTALDGHTCTKAWFANTPTTQLEISVTSEVETLRPNPFDFILEPWALSLPINYPSYLFAQLQSYLGGYFLPMPQQDGVAIEIGQSIWLRSEGNVVTFLTELSQYLSQSVTYVLRETGYPYPPTVTWTEKRGSCRDITVLFMAICRSLGLATRFVSGYHEGDPNNSENHLHAWAEVYLPGAGWRGYDPTYGLAVGDRYIALSAAARPEDAAPVDGSLRIGTPAQSTLEYQLNIEVIG